MRFLTSFKSQPETNAFSSIIFRLHTDQNLSASIIDANHRRFIRTEDRDFIETMDVPPISDSLLKFQDRFNLCYRDLTQQSWRRPSTSTHGPDLATNTAIRTISIALDLSTDYIRLSPYSQGTFRFAGSLFNAVLEVVGLPSLNVKFGDEAWAWYTFKALGGNMEPLLSRVLHELVFALAQSPLQVKSPLF